MDVARRPTFPEEELVKRRAELFTALRQDEDNPAVRAVEALSELLYGAHHPYGRRAKGSVETLERINRVGDLPPSTREYLRPSALSLVVVGDVEASRALDLRRARNRRVDGAPAAVGTVPPPPAPAEASPDDPDAGQGADRHRVRVHDRSAGSIPATTRIG